VRRFIELGYAAEQAGFIFNGTVLRYTARIWDIQPDLKSQGLNQTVTVADEPTTEHKRSTMDFSTPQHGCPATATDEVSSSTSEEILDVHAMATSSLKANLRAYWGNRKSAVGQKVADVPHLLFGQSKLSITQNSMVKASTTTQTM
jgi:hypothetical protein